MINVTLKDIYEVTNRIDDKLDKMEVRISTLEIWKANVLGKLSVLVAGATIVISLSWDFIKSKLTGYYGK